MGVPSHAESNPNDYNNEWKSIRSHLSDEGAATWAGGNNTSQSLKDNLEMRRKWQGIVYEYLLNACLAVPTLDAVVSWDALDETSWLDANNGGFGGVYWPFTPAYPHEGSSQPGLFGSSLDKLAGTTGSQWPAHNREMFYPKPAYYGVRNAITNYFGTAFVVKGSSGQEVMRFVENGNVLLMNLPSSDASWTTQVYEHPDNWQSLDFSGSGNYLFKDSSGSCLACLKPDGMFYVKGHITEGAWGGEYSVPAAPVFKVVGQNQETVAFLDNDGNLKMKGYLLVQGLPYHFRDKSEADAFSSW